MNIKRTGLGGRVLKAVLRAVTRVLFRVRMDGDGTSFVNPRTLIVANHESFLDGLLLALFLPIEATFVVHTTVARNPLIGWLLRFIPHLAVDSTSPLSIKLICKLVESGEPVISFLKAA
jgi:acyl-[acyl-carrier-protein]-phospholipid O-acyltransferase/long-chain-fatty-acid--[acyl-carrier-protein] ligase